MKLLGGLAGILIVLAVRSALTDKYEKVMTAVVTDRPADCLKMVGSTTREENGRTFIVGTIRNTCERKIGNVTIAFQVDAADRTAFRTNAPILAYARDVQPGETRTFKTPYAIGRNDTFRFDKITAF
jgi:hypothetical protein